MHKVSILFATTLVVVKTFAFAEGTKSQITHDPVVGGFKAESAMQKIESGKLIKKTLDNRSIDKFSHPRSRHIEGQLEKTKPLVDFNDLTGWTVTYIEGTVEPIITRSSEEPLWGNYILRTEFHKGNSNSPKASVVLAPPKPIAIPNDFDSINLWRMATRYNRENRPALHYAIQFRDNMGKLQSMGPMGGFLDTGWGIHHYPSKQQFSAGAEFVSITFSGFNEDIRISYFDSLRFYLRSKEAISDSYVPTWKELGIPTRPETILPATQSPAVVDLTKDENSWRFTSTNEEGKKLVFDIKPDKGTLDDISVTYNGKTFFPAVNGGFHWVDGKEMIAPNSPDVVGKFLGGEANGNKLTLNWEYRVTENHPVKARWLLEVINNSLIADLSTDSGAVSEFKFGAVSGIAGKVIEVPYLNIGNWIHESYPPGIFCSDGLYVSCFIDWYNSDASGLFGESSATPGGHFELNASTADHRWVVDPTASDQANLVREYSIINGGSYYWLKTDGMRNPARERIFITIDDHFDEVLPSIPNSTHKHLAETVNDVWVTRAWYAPKIPMLDYFDREFRQWKQCKAYGMEKLNIRLHANINRVYTPRDNGDPTTFIDDFVEPGIGGEIKCQEFFQKMQALGYRIGHYTDHMLLFPLSYHAWDEDTLNLDSNSNWLWSSGNAKQTKISRLIALQKKYNRQLRETYKPNCAYLDQITCPPCWRYTDYDARTPDAGKFSAVYRVFVESLRQEERDFGPVLSEGKTQMFFAGICDSYSQPQRFEMNLLPNFNLNKLHMLSNDSGYELAVFYSGTERHYEALCYEYAYGNIGHLSDCYARAPHEETIPASMLKSYFLIQPLQKYYALTPIKSIEYNVEGHLAPIEAAVKANTLDNNQIKLTYQNGLEVAVNLNKEKIFVVDLNGKEYTLPPTGFAAYLPGHAEAYSALFDGERADFLKTADFIYSDGLGALRNAGPISARHGYTLKINDKEIKVTPTPFVTAETITIDLGWHGVDQAQVTCFDIDENSLGSETLAIDGGKLSLVIDGKSFSYRIKQ